MRLRAPSTVSKQPIQQKTHRSQGTSYGLVLWLLGVAVSLTWAPFAPRESAPGVILLFPSNPGDFLGNLLILVPLAVVLALGGVENGGSRHLRRAIGVIASISIVLEAGQSSIFGRVLSPWDPLLNIAGASAAAWIAIHLAKRGVTAAALLVAVAMSTFLTTAGILVSSAARGRSDFQLRGWSSDHQIIAGDEIGGQRPYRGKIDSAMVCAGTGSTSVCASSGADARVRKRLVAEAERSQRVRLSAVVVPLNDTMSGPARIITFSWSPHSRNATLAQQGRDLVFRVRTPMTGDNGSRPQFILPEAVTNTETYVIGEFALGAARLSARRREHTFTTTFRFGLLDSWLMESWLTVDHFRSLTPGPPRRAATAGAVVLLLPIGLVLGWKRSALRTLLFVLVALISCLFALEHFWLGMPFRFFRHLALPTMACLAGAWLGWLDKGARRLPRSHDSVYQGGSPR